MYSYRPNIKITRKFLFPVILILLYPLIEDFSKWIVSWGEWQLW